MRPKPHAGGFTVIEGIVLVTILVLLAGVVVPIVTTEVSSARTVRAQTDLKVLAEAFSRYFAHTGTWPSNADWNANNTSAEALEGFPCLYTNVHRRSGWAGPYLNTGVRLADGGWSVAAAASAGSPARGFLDPWGNPYRVHVFGRNGAMGANGGIALVCAGQNGAIDTTTSQIVNGDGVADDLVQVVTRRL